MAIAHVPGFPRIGAQRELKRAVEAYWAGKIDQAELMAAGQAMRATNWQQQQAAGLDVVTVGDFAWYDHVLNHSMMFGVIPARFGDTDAASTSSLDTMFRMARGRAPSGQPAAACEMTKWFDTNYHYIVPEFTVNQTFSLDTDALFAEIAEAQAAGYKVKPVLVGPVTYLWLGKEKGEAFDRLSLLPDLLAVYAELLHRLQTLGIEWVQMDEPALVLDLPPDWQQAYESAYNRLQGAGCKTLLTTYFGHLDDNLGLAVNLPVDGLHIDVVRAPEQLGAVLDRLPAYKVLSLGIVNGRNVWRNDLRASLTLLERAYQRVGERLWVSASCSLLHSPVDLAFETALDAEVKNWLAFSVQKLHEIAALGRLIGGNGREKDQLLLAASDAAQAARAGAQRIHDRQVQQRVSQITSAMCERRSPYDKRAKAQHDRFGLPLYPTTTIGSFPQTAEIRMNRNRFRKGELDESAYVRLMEEEIASVIARQEALGLDVLVHGEAERNDMVEYFGEQLEGFAFTRNGWVQSYGSRCVKPPIIVGDIYRNGPMTVEWTTFAQSCTEKPVKGMLTGPVTILCWSFPREDVPRETSCRQLALALRDEVLDLERAGIGIIQIDEPAIREGLPLRRAEWQSYLDWAVDCFRIAASGVDDHTQMHTHMCYSEFNDIIEAIAAMDADVITIETSRSDMALLDVFKDFAYPNEIGPGVYDIHSPNVPDAEWMRELLHKAEERIPARRLWVNPDCGLKTRQWPEVEQALAQMVTVAQTLREEHEVIEAV